MMTTATLADELATLASSVTYSTRDEALDCVANAYDFAIDSGDDALAEGIAQLESDFECGEVDQITVAQTLRRLAEKVWP